MNGRETQGFGRIRAFLWPVHREEYGKLIPMLLMYALISFNYTILRAAKDALIITAPSSGAEALPFLKVWAILPMALLMTFVFTRLCNRFRRETVFYLMMGIFLSFFALFALLLYPYQHSLHPHQFADLLQTMLPQGCSGLIALLRNWTFTAFYVMSEMWGTMIMTVLFWSFANEVTSVKDAKRFYALVLIGANIACYLGGSTSVWISEAGTRFFLPLGNDPWGQSILLICGIVVVLGVAICLLFRWMHLRGLGYTNHSNVNDRRHKMGLRKNFAYIASSKYLIYIAIIVVAYNIAINLTEVVWKDQLKLLYPSPNAYNTYMGQILKVMGLTATCIAIVISGNAIRKLSWTFSALLPPLILAITGAGFFLFLLFEQTPFALTFSALFQTTPLVVSVFFGALQNCLSRATKYTFFDATKEMAFIPLSKESKLNGKAAIDGVGSRVGKSGGALAHQVLLMATGSVALSTPYAAIILMGVVCAWIFAARSLGRRFQDLSDREAEPSQASSSAIQA